MDKKSFSEKLKMMGAIGPFVEQEVLKGQDALAFAEIPPGDGEGAYQIYVITKDKLYWVFSDPSDGFMMYRTYLLRNMLEYEYGKIPAPTPDMVARRALLQIKFIGNSEVGIEATVGENEVLSERHKTIVYGIDELERQLRKIMRHAKNTNSYQDYPQ